MAFILHFLFDWSPHLLFYRIFFQIFFPLVLTKNFMDQKDSWLSFNYERSLHLLRRTLKYRGNKQQVACTSMNRKWIVFLCFLQSVKIQGIVQSISGQNKTVGRSQGDPAHSHARVSVFSNVWVAKLWSKQAYCIKTEVLDHW